MSHLRNEYSNRLKLEDFSFAEKVAFPPNGNSKGPHPTPPHKLAHTFKMKTYAPAVFRRLRNFFGIEPDSYMSSVCGKPIIVYNTNSDQTLTPCYPAIATFFVGVSNYLEFISNSKSGQFFFYSHDGRYMIKTQTSEETKFLNRILPHYYKHVTENPDTLLVRFLGIHRLFGFHISYPFSS